MSEIPSDKPSPVLPAKKGLPLAPTQGNTPPKQAAPEVKDPSWWRLGAVPFLVLLMVAAAADFAMPRDGLIGIGAGIGSVLFLLSFALLRKDLSTGETLFILVFAAINFFALACSGRLLHWCGTLIVPLLMLLLLPSRQAATPQAGTRYRCWWSFWIARRPKGKGMASGLRGCLPMVICLLAGGVCFILFLTIFAFGNPVVEQVWLSIVDGWNSVVAYFHISWDFAIHVLCWLLGIFAFGFYTFRRFYARPAAPVEFVPGRSILPALPFCTLLGINLAFGIATYTDMVYLWCKEVPEGISKTAYLHEGAASIAWASFLAALALVFFFRQRGSVRYSVFPKWLGYALALQTFLLAVSVWLRLYYQIGDYGFTEKRICAVETMLIGVVALIVLLRYMSSSDGLWKCCRMGAGAILLALFAFCICSPARIAGSLNLRYIGSHPHWKFGIEDFRHGKFDAKENLAFAEYVYNNAPKDSSESASYASGFASELKEAAWMVERRAQLGSWLTWTLSMQQDIPAAERILQRPIVVHGVHADTPAAENEESPQ